MLFLRLLLLVQASDIIMRIVDDLAAARMNRVNYAWQWILPHRFPLPFADPWSPSPLGTRYVRSKKNTALQRLTNDEGGLGVCGGGGEGFDDCFPSRYLPALKASKSSRFPG